MDIPDPASTPVTEHEGRAQRLRRAMAEDGIDLLVCYSDAWRTANIRYFTDFRPVDGINGIEQSVLLFGLESDPVLFADEGCLDAAQDRSAFEVRPLSEMAPDLRRRVQTTEIGSVAIAGADQIPAPVMDTVRRALAPLEAVPSSVLARVKAVKTAWEVEQLRYAAALTDVAVHRMKEVITSKSPVSERDLAREADMAMIRAGAEGIAFLSMVQSGPRSAFSLALPSDRLIQSGDIVLTDIGARYGNYVADGGRGFTVGEVSAEVMDLVDASVSAVQVGLEFARPGITAASLNDQMQRVLVERGYARFSVEARGRGTGHGTGMDPEEEHPWIGPTNYDLLEPGMVFTLKATINKPGVGGLRTERLVHLTTDAATPLDRAPMRNHW